MDVQRPGPVCLDLTRLLSRAGRGALTGVDRVERAYADWVLAECASPLFLFRTSRGFILLEARGARAFLSCLDGGREWDGADFLSRITGRGARPRHRAEATLRRHAIARCLPNGLPGMLRRHLQAGSVYLNTGHSNLSGQVLGALRSVHGLRIAVLIHDLIPITHPQFSRPGVPEVFAAKIDRVANIADLVICNSADTDRHVRQRYPALHCVTAHLGLSALPAAEPLPTPLDPDKPRFVCLGTIEGRKNHGLLLDVWDHLTARLAPAAMPDLHIVGHRGWRAEALLDRLDSHPLRGTAIFEHSNLNDGQVRSLLEGSRGLLFPTLAEGFGLPPLEAARLGVLPVCSDLPILREVMGKSAVYLDPLDAYSWAETITKRISDNVTPADLAGFRAPTWQAHFEKVTAALWSDGQKGGS